MALIQNKGKPGYFTGLLILALVCSSRNSRKLKDHKNIGIYSSVPSLVCIHVHIHYTFHSPPILQWLRTEHRDRRGRHCTAWRSVTDILSPRHLQLFSKVSPLSCDILVCVWTEEDMELWIYRCVLVPPLQLLCWCFSIVSQHQLPVLSTPHKPLQRTHHPHKVSMCVQTTYMYM